MYEFFVAFGHFSINTKVNLQQKKTNLALYKITKARSSNRRNIIARIFGGLFYEEKETLYFSLFIHLVTPLIEIIESI